MAEQDKPVMARKKGAAFFLTLNRPDAGNAINGRMMELLRDGLDRARKSDGVALVVLGGTGADFCVGRDTGEPPPVPRPSPYQMMQRSVEQFAGVYRAIHESPLPVVAAVRGKVVGTGLALAAAADLTIAAEDASFCLPEMTHNVPPLLAMSTLIDRVPPKLIAHLVYTAAPIDAATAQDYGIVNQVVGVAGLARAVGALTKAIAGCGEMQRRTVKHFLRRARTMNPEGAVDFSANMLAVIR